MLIGHGVMEHSLIFARHFAQLVWLLLHEPANTDEQKVALRAMVTLSKNGAINLSLHSDSLQVNGEVVPFALTGVTDLAKQMKLHGLAMITVDASASPAHILGVARIVSGMPTLDDGGAAAEGQRVALGATTVRFAAKPRTSQSLSMPEMEFGDVLDDPLAEARAKATPRSMPSIPTPSKSHDAGGLFAQFAAPRTPTESPEELLKQLDIANDPAAIADLLDDLVVHAELAAKERKSSVVSTIMTRMLRRETTLVDPEAKRIIATSLRRLSKPEPLRCVASQLGLYPCRGKSARPPRLLRRARAAQGGRDVAAAHAQGPAVVRRAQCGGDARRNAGA
jgi:hypothetical protein